MYPNTPTFTRDQDGWRAFLGQYGVSGKMQTAQIGTLSEGQKSRIVIAMICMGHPNLLLLDEPTNHLDMEGIDALAQAIKAYKAAGGDNARLDKTQPLPQGFHVLQVRASPASSVADPRVYKT